MIRRLDAAMRNELAVAPIDRGLALYEAAMMTRCAQLPTESAARGRPGGERNHCFGDQDRGREPGVLVEVGSLAAAQRYRLLLAGLTRDVEIRTRLQGLRHQFEVYQLVVAARDEPKVINRLERAWDCGEALSTGSGQLTECMRRRAAARATWRAALLVAGPGRGVEAVRVRLADGATAQVLMAAARTLAVPAQRIRRPGIHIIAVVGQEPMLRLRAEIGGDAPADAPSRALTYAG